MSQYAHHHTDTPHGVSHAPISISVLLTILFVGAQWILFTLVAVTVPASQLSVYSGVNPFTVASATVSVLLLAFLAVDFQRNRIEAHGKRRFQYFIFGVAAALLLVFGRAARATGRAGGECEDDGDDTHRKACVVQRLRLLPWCNCLSTHHLPCNRCRFVAERT